jgi:hypothetical protein
MMNLKQQSDLTEYRTFGFPLLALMGLIALAGVILTVVVSYIF